jgi:TonB-linked SusC/RagA family outer membrane protein
MEKIRLKRLDDLNLYLKSAFRVTLQVLLISLFSVQAMAGVTALTLTGKITDDKGAGLGGASIVEKGTKNSTLTKEDGTFTITVSKANAVLVVSYVGFAQQEITLSGNQTTVAIRMAPANQAMDSVVVVGYGRQRKESVVGAITQTTGKVLQRAGGVSNIGAALTGNVPGVITVQGTGMPGAEDPQIFIRGQGTWNNAGPLILVDGIERSMAGVDVGSVESISILKDASATAVFGVKGANGVVLITTKRGVEGRANINVTVNSTLKIPSRLPAKYDAYDALMIRNRAIERELGVSPGSWQDYTPQPIIEKYRNPANQQERERYPNIDWQSESLKKLATAQNANLSISGGSGFVRYFTSVDVLHEGDIMKIPPNNKGYEPGFYYDRLNLRANLDFKLTNTTTLSTNLSGLHGKRQTTYSGFEYSWYQGIYGNAPDLYYPQYSDGSYGYYPLNPVATNNPANILGNNGVRNEKTTQMTTDFILTQDLKALVKNLTFRGSYSLDNTFLAVGGITDGAAGAITKWIDPNTGEERYGNTSGINQFDYVRPPWGVAADAFQNPSTRRRTVYQAQLNHSARIGRHNITTMGLFMRNENAQGSAFPDFREDWVFRTTYNFANRYFAEFNGAYNGSQRFGPDYRFEFFPSAAVGWTLTNESFMKRFSWLSSLKVRGSYGLVGSDQINGNYLYLSQYTTGGVARLGDNNNNANSPYTWFRESSIGNPEIHWETVAKTNVGVDYSLWRGLFEGTIEVYRDYRTNVLIGGPERAVPVYFGGTPPPANLGETVVKGYEVELKFNKSFKRDMRLWGNIAITHAKDKTIYRDDPQLLDEYQKQAGYQIGQTRSHIRAGYHNTWDEVYGSTAFDANDNSKLPGQFNLLDFNGDGVVNSFDGRAPYGYPGRPQNTYTASIGFDYKRFAVFVQFYGVNNVTRELTQGAFGANLNSVYKQGDYWSKDNQDARGPMPRWKSVGYGSEYGDFFQYDGSYVRLKTAEISYTLDPTWVKKAGIQSLRVFVNGNNLTFWSKMPDDREGNIGNGNSSGQGAYPTVRRVNFGFNLSL